MIRLWWNWSNRHVHYKTIHSVPTIRSFHTRTSVSYHPGFWKCILFKRNGWMDERHPRVSLELVEVGFLEWRPPYPLHGTREETLQPESTCNLSSIHPSVRLPSGAVGMGRTSWVTKRALVWLTAVDKFGQVRSLLCLSSRFIGKISFDQIPRNHQEREKK